jgi:prolyl oligopeptidase
VYIFDVATGEKLSDVVPNVNGPTAGGDVAWNKDNSGFWYTRYPHKGERPDEDLFFYQQVYYHQLGTPSEADAYAIGKEFPYIAEIALETSPDGEHILASVANGDGGEYAHYLLDPSGNWTQITKFKDLVRTAVFGPDNALIMLCRMDAPRGKILRLAPGQTDLTQATVLVKPSDATIKSYLPTPNYLFVIDLLGGPSQMRIFDYKGLARKEIPVKPISSLWSMVDIGGDSILFRTSSYTEPAAWYRFDPVKWEVTRTALFQVSPADFSDVEVVREFATSKDGTKVPVNIVKRKGTILNGENPTLLTGYGGYGISRTPGFSASRRLWLDQGGVYVVANLRGGGEYGEEWHLAGNLTKKQNVFDDFEACAQYLIDTGYTNPSRLVIEGGSNGGLLMGAAFTQHPELYAVVVSHVGIYDMLRVELDPNGVFNITEFGTVKNPDHFKALYAYSPYHNVKDGAAYPAIMFLTGLYDGRVNPAQSRKMTARMQAATGSGKPVFLRTSASTGHGGGTALSKQIEKETDVYSFIINQLGMTFRYDK